jgi:hypothetical protein
MRLTGVTKLGRGQALVTIAVTRDRTEFVRVTVYFSPRIQGDHELVWHPELFRAITCKAF